MRKSSQFDQVKDGLGYDRLYIYDFFKDVFNSFELKGHKFSHSVLPISDQIVLVIEQKGPYASLFDLKKMAVIGRITAPNRMTFSGHGAALVERGHLFLGSYHSSGPGSVLQYDMETSRLIRLIDTNGVYPHDIKYDSQNDYLYIANKGKVNKKTKLNERASLSVINLKTNNIISQRQFTVSNIRAAHLELLPNNSLFIATAMYTIDGEKYKRNAKGIVHYESPLYLLDRSTLNYKSILPDKVSGKMNYNLSIQWNQEMNEVIVSHVGSQMVSFWKVDGQLISHFDLPTNERPHGASYLGFGKYIVSSNNGKGYIIDSISGIKKIIDLNDGYGLAGSHHLVI